MMERIKQHRKEIIIGALLLITVALFAGLLYVNADKNDKQDQLDHIFLESLENSYAQLSLDFNGMDDVDRMYFYTDLVSNLKAAEAAVRHTPYQKSQTNLSYALERLHRFLKINFDPSSGFLFEAGAQAELHRILLEINESPANDDAVNRLNVFLNQPGI